jgi:hypothetical protein
MPPNNPNVHTSLKPRAPLPSTLASNHKSSFCPADPFHKSQIAWLALIWKTKTTAKRRRGRDKKLHSQRDSARLPRSAKRRNANTLKCANVCLVLHSHQETHRPLAHHPLEETELRAEETEVEEAATVPRETVSPILLPTSHPRGPSISQTNFSIPHTNRDRQASLAQGLLLSETNSLSVSLEVLKDVVVSVSLLVARSQALELALASVRDMSRTITPKALLQLWTEPRRDPAGIAARLTSLSSVLSLSRMTGLEPTVLTFFKGNVCCDFMTGNMRDDKASSRTRELIFQKTASSYRLTQ